LGHLGTILGHLETILKVIWRHLGTILGHLGHIWATCENTETEKTKKRHLSCEKYNPSAAKLMLKKVSAQIWLRNSKIPKNTPPPNELKSKSEHIA